MTLYKQAQKELRRIQRSISSIEKRGYSFTKLPLKFRGATRYGEKKTRWSKKEVESLKATKAKDLYKYAEYRTKSGRMVRGEVGREIEREKAATKAAQTRKAIRNYIRQDTESAFEIMPWSTVSRMTIDDFLDRKTFINFTDRAYEKVVDWIKNKIEEFGEDKVSRALQLAKNEGMMTELKRYKNRVDLNLSKLENPAYWGKEVKVPQFDSSDMDYEAENE